MFIPVGSEEGICCRMCCVSWEETSNGELFLSLEGRGRALCVVSAIVGVCRSGHNTTVECTVGVDAGFPKSELHILGRLRSLRGTTLAWSAPRVVGMGSVTPHLQSTRT